MAVRIDASGDKLYRTANLPALSGFTIAGWGYRNNAQNGAYRYFAGLEDATSNSNGWLLIGWAADNAFQIASDASTVNSASSPAASTWFYWFIQRSGTSMTIGYKTSGGSWVTTSTTGTLSWTPAVLHLGNDSYDEWTDISLERVRVWDAALTTTELDSEMASATPVRTSNLRANWPLTTSTDLTDTTANGYNLSSAGTLSTYTPGPLGTVISVSDTATVSESVTVSVSGGVSSRTVSVSDAATVGETVAARLAAALAVSVSDAATVAESRTVSVVAPGTRSVSVSDAATVAESVTAAMAAALRASVSDAATVGEAVTVVRQSPAAPLSISVSDAATVAESTKVLAIGGACIGGVLTVDGTNGRYFRNGSGIVFLAGFHTWASIQDSWPSLPITALDFDEYLDALVSYGCNFTKAWILESAKDWGDSVQYFAPLPWARTGPGTAHDGRPKFDLTQFDDDYFTRLRERCIRLGNAGIYVCVQLFQGWHISKKGFGTGDPWANHPMNAANNINGVDGDTNGDVVGLETRTTTLTATYNIQKAYVEHVIDTLNDLDNVIFEISNEEENSSLTWQRALVDYIQTYEAGKPKQHLVGMTVCWPSGDNQDLYDTTTIDWLSPGGDFVPEAASAAKISAFDTDHVGGLTSEYKWILRALAQGHGGTWYMDEWAGETYGNDTRNNATYQKIRSILGYALDYAARIDLANATPQPSLASTGYCLAKTTGTAQILAYQDGSGAFTVNLTSLSGTFALEWLRTATGATQAGSNVSGGATRTLTPPWAGEDVLAYLWQSTYTVSVTDSATVSESVTVRIAAALTANVSDSATVGESVTVQVAAATTRAVSVTDNATVAESVTVQMVRAASVTDTATLSETVAAQMAAALAVNVSDTAAVGESVNVIRTVAGQMYVNVADAITATDTPTATIALRGVSVTDAVTVAETVTTAMALAGVSVADAATIAESVTVAVQAQGTLLVSVSDGAAVSDTAATGPLGLAGVSVSDGAALAETVGAQTLAAGLLQINVSDAVGIVETCGAAMALSGVSVVEAVTVAELIVAYVVGAAHADWTTSNAAVWRWTVGDAAVNHWTMSDRSKS